jgi:hypothetical protein
MTLDELAARLALPRSTIYYWIHDLPISRTTSQSVAQRRASRAMQAKFRQRRAQAYANGRETFQTLAADPTFRDFVNLYLAEGYKRNRNRVSLANSDPAVVKIAASWIRRFTRNKIVYSIQYHADQDLDALRRFRGGELAIDPAVINLQRKSNTNGLAARTWRSRYGVLTVCCGDTCLRSQLEAWMDCLREQWLDSILHGA